MGATAECVVEVFVRSDVWVGNARPAVQDDDGRWPTGFDCADEIVPGLEGLSLVAELDVTRRLSHGDWRPATIRC